MSHRQQHLAWRGGGTSCRRSHVFHSAGSPRQEVDLPMPAKTPALAHFLPELPWAISRKRFARGRSSYPRRRSSSPWGGMSGGQSLLASPNMRYSAIANEKSTMSQSKKSIAFTPNQAQFCEMHTLMGSHPTGFRYSVDVIRSVMACQSGAHARCPTLSPCAALVRHGSRADLPSASAQAPPGTPAGTPIGRILTS
jgi:hypothetical protein